MEYIRETLERQQAALRRLLLGERTGGSPEAGREAPPAGDRLPPQESRAEQRAFRELAASLALSRVRMVLFFLIPAAIPSLVTGLRLSFGYSWRALIAAELIAASSGLGYMIMDAEQMQRADEVIVGILVIGVLGWLFDAAFSFLVSALLSRRFPELGA